MMSAVHAGSKKPSLGEAFRFWLKLGFISFGGPTGQIAIMHTELVERRKWISEDRFLHALNYCMLLPGPEAQQLAIYAGWLLHGTWGGVIAGSLFVLPSAVLLWALSYVYVAFGKVAWISAIFFGLKPAVLAIVAAAVIRIGRKALKNEVMWTVAALAFISIYFLEVPFPWIIAAAGTIGFFGGKKAPDLFITSAGGHGEPAQDDSHSSGTLLDHPALFRRALRVTATCLIIWWTPVLALWNWLGPSHALVKQGIFFSKAAMVTFGGAYAVLPYVAQQAVERFGWLAEGQMLDGIGLAETTPGPLIMVLQFVGFVGGWNQAPPLSPVAAATLGAAITTWVTFVPCFLWILLGAPYIERLRGYRPLSAALSTVTAAVVGVVLNLAVVFGTAVLFAPGTPVNWFGVIVCAVAFIGIVRWNWDVPMVVAGSGIVGLLWMLVSG